jgi:RNA polymerase sigma-70 factor (ECF subfamily)
MEGLHIGYREVIVLRYVNDLPVKEIALLLGETENNVSVRLHRALAALKKRANPPKKV